MVASNEIIETAVPLSKVRSTILDFGRYSDFLPEIDVSKVLDQKATSTQVHFESSLGKKIEYVLEFQHEPETSISWELLRGSGLKRNSGLWEFGLLEDGRTRIKYGVEIEMGFFVPEFLVKQFLDANLRKTLERFLDQARKRS